MLQWKHELSTTLNQITPNCHYFFVQGFVSELSAQIHKTQLGLIFLGENMTQCFTVRLNLQHPRVNHITTPWLPRLRGHGALSVGHRGSGAWRFGSLEPVVRCARNRWNGEPLGTPKSTSSWSSSLRTAKKFIGPPWTISRSSCILSGRTMEPCHFRRHICSSF